MWGNKERLDRIERKLNLVIRILLKEINMGKVEDAIAALQAQAAKNVTAEGAAVALITAPPANNDDANAAAVAAVTASLATSETALTAAETPVTVPPPVPAQ